MALCLSFAELFRGDVDDDKQVMLQAIIDTPHAPHNLRTVTQQQLQWLANSGHKKGKTNL